MRIAELDLPPPACLAGFSVDQPDPALRDALVTAFISEEEDRKSRDWHAAMRRSGEWISVREELALWMIACPCGAPHGKLFGVRREDKFDAPVHYACLTCNATIPIFDPTVHGWNALTSRRKPRPRKPANTTFAMRCASCKHTHWRAAVLLTYQGDHYDAIPNDRLADHFGAIAIGGACASCEAVRWGFSVECG